MSDYNQFTPEYEAYGQRAVTDTEIGYKTVLQLLGDVSGKNVLDYGCGVGKFVPLLQERDALVVGTDIAEKELERARLLNPGVEFPPIGEVLQKYKGQFDAVVLNFVVIAIADKKEVLALFENSRSLLKPGGRLVLLNSNYDKSGGRTFLSFSIGDVVKEIGHPIKIFLGSTPTLEIEDYFYSETFYRETLEDHGFTVETVVEPLATGDEFTWKDERTHPPFIVISALKT